MRRLSFSIFAILPCILFFCLSCYSQKAVPDLKSISDANFEVIGAADFGPHKSSRTERDTLVLLVVLSPAESLQQAPVSKFLEKVKSKLTPSQSFCAYFLDDRRAAEGLFRTVRLDEESKETNPFLPHIRALAFHLINDRKELLRFFKNGMTEKDFDAIGLELDS